MFSNESKCWYYKNLCKSSSGIFCHIFMYVLVHNCDGERLLRVPWTARRSDQSILKEINPEYSLEGLMLKLKLQNFGHLMWRADSLGKTLMLGKIKGKRKEGCRGAAALTQWTWICKLWEIVEDRGVWPAAVHGVTNSWTWLSNWTTACTIYVWILNNIA